MKNHKSLEIKIEIMMVAQLSEIIDIINNLRLTKKKEKVNKCITMP